MKNQITSAVFFLFSLSFFGCNNSSDPTPANSSGTPTMAGFGAADAGDPTAMQIGNTNPKQIPRPTVFEWQFAKTVVLPMYKGLNLTSPFAIVNEDAGDISWGGDGGCYYAIKARKMMMSNLKIVDVKTVKPEYLKTLNFDFGQANWAPYGSQSWTNYMPDGTVIAYKTSTGKYILVIVKSSSPLTLEIYNEHYYQVY